MKTRALLFILAILSICMTGYSQEVFVPDSRGGISPLTRAVVMGNKTSGKALLSMYGAKLTTSLVLDGKFANTILPKTSNVFYVFMPKNVSVQAWKLIPLKAKKKTRELPFMKTSVYSGSKTNLEDIQLMATAITDEIYELRPMADLKNGEYALAFIDNGVPTQIYDFRIESNLPPYPPVSRETLLAEFYPETAASESSDTDISGTIIRWYFDSDPRGARIFYRVISSVPNEVKNTNESYMTTTPLEETKAINIPGLTYDNSNDVVIEIKLTKRGFEEQTKRYNVRQVLDQQEISGFFEMVEKQ